MNALTNSVIKGELKKIGIIWSTGVSQWVFKTTSKPVGYSLKKNEFVNWGSSHRVIKVSSHTFKKNFSAKLRLRLTPLITKEIQMADRISEMVLMLKNLKLLHGAEGNSIPEGLNELFENKKKSGKVSMNPKPSWNTQTTKKIKALLPTKIVKQLYKYYADRIMFILFTLTKSFHSRTALAIQLLSQVEAICSSNISHQSINMGMLFQTHKGLLHLNEKVKINGSDILKNIITNTGTFQLTSTALVTDKLNGILNEFVFETLVALANEQSPVRITSGRRKSKKIH